MKFHSTNFEQLYLKVVSKLLVTEIMNKMKAILFHPLGYLVKKISIILHMLRKDKFNFKPSQL
jgi:hypothetical protein